MSTALEIANEVVSMVADPRVKVLEKERICIAITVSGTAKDARSELNALRCLVIDAMMALNAKGGWVRWGGRLYRWAHWVQQFHDSSVATACYSEAFVNG